MGIKTADSIQNFKTCIRFLKFSQRNIYIGVGSVFWIRIRIRIHRIHMFLGHPVPDPLVRGMDPDPSIGNNSKKP